MDDKNISKFNEENNEADEALRKIIAHIDEVNQNTVEDETIIAVSNSYISKYYLDERLNSLAEDIKKELKILLVKLTEENGGIAELIYSDINNDIILHVYCDEKDYLYDEIGARLEAGKIETEYKEAFENLALFCKMKFHQVDKFMEEHSHNV